MERFNVLGDEEITRAQDQTVNRLSQSDSPIFRHIVDQPPKIFLSKLSPYILSRGVSLLTEYSIFHRAHRDKVDLGREGHIEGWAEFICSIPAEEISFQKLYFLAHSYDFHSDTINYGRLRVLLELKRREEYLTERNKWEREAGASGV